MSNFISIEGVKEKMSRLYLLPVLVSSFTLSLTLPIDPDLGPAKSEASLADLRVGSGDKWQRWWPLGCLEGGCHSSMSYLMSHFIFMFPFVNHLRLFSSCFCRLFVVRLLSYSRADRCKNCAFNHKSMKFGTHLGHALRKIFGYRAISDLAHGWFKGTVPFDPVFFFFLS